MSERLPEHIEPLRLARSLRLLQGQLPLARFTRLVDATESDKGFVNAELEFSQDSQGQAIVRGRIRCQLRLICQRCMQTMDWPIDTSFTLAFIESESEIELLGEAYEPLILEDSMLSLVEMLEDELLLVLPIVPSHELDECEATEILAENTEDLAEAEEEVPSEKENPFAVLAGLKDLKHKD